MEAILSKAEGLPTKQSPEWLVEIASLPEFSLTRVEGIARKDTMARDLGKAMESVEKLI